MFVHSEKMQDMASDKRWCHHFIETDDETALFAATTRIAHYSRRSGVACSKDRRMRFALGTCSQRPFRSLHWLSRLHAVQSNFLESWDELKRWS